LQSIAIDTREPPWVTGLSFDVPKFDWTLSAGDAWLNCDDVTVVVERKTLTDLLSSIADRRLFVQAKGMVELSPWSYVVVIPLARTYGGNIVLKPGKPSGWRWKDVQGALITLQEMGVVVLWRESDSLYRDTLLWLAGRDRSNKRLAPKRTATLLSPAERVLCDLAISIGPDRAEILLGEHGCGSLAWALDWLTTEDPEFKIPGVGPGIRRSVRQVMGLEADNKLSVTSKDWWDKVTERENE